MPPTVNQALLLNDVDRQMSLRPSTGLHLKGLKGYKVYQLREGETGTPRCAWLSNIAHYSFSYISTFFSPRFPSDGRFNDHVVPTPISHHPHAAFEAANQARYLLLLPEAACERARKSHSLQAALVRDGP